MKYALISEEQLAKITIALDSIKVVFAAQVALDVVQALKPSDPVAHMFPSTLEEFEYGKKADYAYSIERGDMVTGEETVPLYRLDGVTE